MRYSLGQAPAATLVRPAPETVAPAAVTAAAAKELPYDYVAKFVLTGKASNRVQDVINVSVDGAFVAVAIGYSFIPARLSVLSSDILNDPPPGPTIAGPAVAEPAPSPFAAAGVPRPTTLAEIVAETIAIALQLDFQRTTPDGQKTVNANKQQVVDRLRSVIEIVGDPRGLLQCLLVKLCGIDFKYSIVDSATGRELQNQPIHNIAGLGEATGERPFRPLGKPMLFAPRSTIRIEIEEVSEGPLYTGAELYIVLHGYKMLGYGTAGP
jgi:hypothetical protein